MTVAAIGRMSSVEFGDWLRYAELEPFGPLAAGAAAAAFLNFYRDAKTRPEAFTAAEALGMFALDAPEPLSQDELSMMARDRAWAATMRKVAKPRPQRRRRAQA